MQTDSEPKRLSPIHYRHQILEARFRLRAGWLIPEGYAMPEEEKPALQEGLALVDISAKGKLMLKGAKADGIITTSFGTMPTNHGDVIEDKSRHIVVAKLTPDEFLMLTLPGEEKELASSLESEIESQNIFVTLIDQTSGLVGLSIVGAKSTGVIRKLCALPFNSRGFPDLHVAQSSLANVRTTIIRYDRGDLPTYELYADRSYAEYLWDTILDAGRDFDIRPVGW